MKSKNLWFSAALLLLAVAAAGAQPGQGQRQGPCAADRQQFCADVQPGQGRIAACLREHQGQLSAQCKQRLQRRMSEIRSRVQGAHRACRQDIQTHCAGIQRGQGRIFQCLKQNEASLSAACKQALAPRNTPASDPIPEPIEPSED
ncbi:MAG: cysteine rich repeat-containing protein [Leptospirales bacterium]|nr:cysteine rich repeat-containing protein [Leptospirales bacterium]